MNPFPPASDLLSRLGAADLLDALADGAYLTDCDRRILFWNRAAERIMGWTNEDVVGRTCFDNVLVHVDKDGHPLCGQEHCPLHRSMVTGHPSRAPLLVFAQSKQGRRVPVEVSVAPVRNARGDVVGGIELFRDMTEGMRELWRAKRIQDLALECPLPADRRVEIERCYQPQEVVGGDFCRVERVEDDAYVLLLADVMGHGVTAALYTMQLRSLWEDHRAELDSPSRLLGVFNTRLSTLMGDTGYFASAVCIRYQPATGNLACVRAGHPAPLLLRGDAVIPCPGDAQPALGLFPETVYTGTVERLEPGEAMLLYTDGAVEIEDATGQELGPGGLARLVGALAGSQGAAGVPIADLEKALVRYCAQVHLPDDLTLLKLRRCPEA